MDTAEQEHNLRPNDVTLILRPILDSDSEWDGNFEILIAGVGPATVPEEETRELISMAMLLATVIPMMEQDVALTERIMIECAKLYGDADDVDLKRLTTKIAEFLLTETSETVGGMQ